MTRLLFVGSIIVIILIGKGVFILSDHFGLAAFIVMILGFVSGVLRRHYLGIKPWWGGTTKEVIRYFSEP